MSLSSRGTHPREDNGAHRVRQIKRGWVIKQTMSNPELVPSVGLEAANLEIQLITNNPAVVNQWIRQQGAKAVKSVRETK